MTTGQSAISYLDQAIPVTVRLHFLYAPDFYYHASRQLSAFDNGQPQLTNCSKSNSIPSPL